jgi:peptidoglycan lytic transglycosylase G
VTEGERSAAEREAARLEREQRRAGEAEPDGYQDAPFAADPAHGGDDEEDFEPAEMPLGTRRVAHRERTATRPSRAHARDRRPARAARARPKARGMGRWIGRLLALAVLAVALAAIFFAISVYQPFQGKAHGHVTVVIPLNSGAKQIGSILAAKGVISSGFFFELHATLSGDRSKLRSGTFQLQYDMSYSAALKVLMTAPPAAKVTNLTTTPGQTRIHLSHLLHAQHVPGDYLSETRHSPVLNPTQYGAPANTPTLEGFLFPDTYQLRVPIKMSSLITDQLKRFKQQFAAVNLAGARRRHLTPYAVLIVASMVQAEAQTSHDMPLVASVIYNRLSAGMMLQFDSTTRYAVDNYTRPLTVSELKSPSPWNTHTHTGLPPTPINNPDLAAIQAAASAPQTNYLYFVSKPCSGALAFESSYSKFLNDVAAFNATQSQNGQRPRKRC